MTKVYACLAGNWVCLNNDPKCTIGESHKEPSLWWNEGASLYSPCQKEKDYEHSYYGLDYLHIFYEGKDWRINPIFVQIVTE